jgi:hypothetical protein
MSNNLVDRLKGLYMVGPDGAYGTRSFADFIPPISLEAARRIEVLEAALQEIIELPSVSQDECCDIAMTAMDADS